MPATSTLAQQLLDAQVAFHLDRLSGADLGPTVQDLADQLFAAAGEHQLADLIDAEALTGIVVRALATVPGSAAVAAIIEMATDVAYAGPTSSFTAGDVVEREQVEALLDQVLALTPTLERALARLSASPLVGTISARFMGRIVGEVLQANKAVADKLPGLGSLVSFGTSAASKVIGAADKQLEGLLGDTMGKGGQLAVGRLNRIVIDTIQDPTTREAILQVWDLVAQEPVVGLDAATTREQLSGIADAVHELAVTALASEQVAGLGRVVVAAFVERFGGYTPTELLDQLDLSQDDLVGDLLRLAPAILDALRESGDLERVIRAQLQPFYDSPEVARLLS